MDKIFRTVHPRAEFYPQSVEGNEFVIYRAYKKDHFHAEIFIVSLKLLKS